MLTQRGQLLPDGRHGAIVVRSAGIRVAGYSDPFERRRADGYRALREPDVTESQQRAFWRWLQPLVGRIDAVMVHSPALAGLALEELRAAPPAAPLVFLTGHTHEQALVESDARRGAERRHRRRRRRRQLPREPAVRPRGPHLPGRPSFEPLAVDLVRIDAPDGSAERRAAAARGS